tara:strand:- start:8394 stop:12425 length:4032 start_codon:yes stop_codon:yes gene_type:complete
MAEFRLGRLKFNWRGDWTTSTAYVVDDIVRFGATSFVCIGNHTSAGSASNFTSDSIYWNTHTSGFDYKGQWTTTTAYVVDDVVQEGGNLYICTSQHTSTGLSSNWYTSDFPARWELYAEGLNFRGNLTTNTYYGINDVAKFGANEYRCIDPVQIAGDIHSKETDPAGIGSDGFFPPAANFSPLSLSLNNEGQYIETARYERGDIVEFTGATYVAIGTNPQSKQPNENPNDWKFLNLGIGTGANDSWNESRAYSKGEIVRFGGNTYQADVLKIEPFNRPTGIGSTTFDSGVNGWSLLHRGFSWTGAYTTSRFYEIGDIAEFQSSAYISVASTNTGTTPGTDSTIWQAFAIGDSAALLTTKGDLLTRNGTGPTRQGIGTQGTFLNVSTSDEIQWEFAAKRTKIYYVDSQKGNDNFSGESPDAAFKTVAFAATSTNPQLDVVDAVYDNTTGITTISTATNHGMFVGGEIKIVGLHFTCSSGLGPGTEFPSGAEGYYFTISGINSDRQLVTRVGPSTIPHVYSDPQPAGALNQLTNAAPVILKLSAGVFNEDLPIVLPKNFSIAGDVLRGSTIKPNPGISTDGVTPNDRSTMFFVSDATTIQAITMKGLKGFDYDVNDPFNTDKMQHKVGVGTTACGVYIRLNPDESILTRSPYIKDCTAFSDNAQDGTGHGGAIGIFIEGGQHHLNPEGKGFKSMVFDAFTNVHSDGVGFMLEDDAVAEVVSCFTYYCAYGYYSDDGSEIRSLSGNNSYGTYGAVATGFSTHEVARPAKLYGDKMATVVGTYAGTFGVGATMRGTESGARAELTNDQTSADAVYFKYFAGYGNTSSDPTVTPNGAIGIGTTVFKPGEFVEVDSVGAGATGYFRIASAANAVAGQKDILLEVAGLTTTPQVGDAIGFTTVGLGFSDSNTYIVRTQSNYVEGTSLDVNEAVYDPNIGVVTAFTSVAHGLLFGDFIRVNTGSLVFTCDKDGNISSTAYPRPTDAIAGNPIPVLAGTGSTTLVFNVLNTTGENQASTNLSDHAYIGQEGGIGKTSVAAIVAGNGRATVTIAPGKGASPTIGLDDQEFLMRSKFSKIRLTGHDFLLIGTGGTVPTNYPNVNENSAAQGQETSIKNTGKIFFVSTDQGGNFRVGEFFSVNQLTGAATLDASAFNLSGLTELRLGAIGGQIGEAINEFSSDETMGGDSNTASPTEKAVRGFLTRGKMDATSGILVPPRGPQSGRPTGADLLEGGLRYDEDANGFEFYNGGSWLPLGAYASIDATNSITAGNRQQIFANTSGGSFTITLPASPVKGDSVRIFDVAKTFDSSPLTVGRNGNPIMGDAADMTVNTEGAAFELVFYDGTQGWRLITV